jgi:hypothetical protein
MNETTMALKLAHAAARQKKHRQLQKTRTDEETKKRNARRSRNPPVPTTPQPINTTHQNR